MQFEAVYKQGRLEFIQPVRFVHKQFKVRVEVPEHEVIRAEQGGADTSPTGFADEWLARLEAIKQEVLQIPEDDLPELTEKQDQYMRAFSLREER